MRSSSREIVFKYIFSKLFNPDDEGLFAVMLSELDNESDKDFAAALLKAVEENNDRYDETVSRFSHNFKLDRLFKADLCAIKIGMAELDKFPETPVPVAIDEAVKLSVKFSTDRSPDFVNGILAAYSKEVKK